MRTGRTILLQAALLAAIASPAQQEPPFRCAAGDLSLLAPPGGFTPEQLAEMEASRRELEAFTREFERSHVPGERNPYIVPVVFHIIHDHGLENIGDAQVHDAMRVLNEDFNKRNPDWQDAMPEFLHLVADVGIEFRLAHKDPQGNCTTGITRTVSELTHEGNQAMKDLIQWPRNRYLNVWVAAWANGSAGYATFPGSVNSNPGRDGIVLRYDYVGAIGAGSVRRSHTLTHEVGHWLNLSHVWGGSNNAADPNNCGMDDGVADTPNTTGWTTCVIGGRSCDGTLDNVENFMDYSYCYKMFTLGQATRMLAALNSSTSQRNNLWQPSNLALTGLDGTQMLCAARFTSDARIICAGEAITFTDLSYHDVAARTWDFPGGTPGTSTDPSPVVTYAQPGTYPVTLTVQNGPTTLSAFSQGHVIVRAVPGAPVPLEDGFEDHADLATSPWAAMDPGNDGTFEITSAAAFSGNNSVRLRNTAAKRGQVDELVSETLDMSSVQGIRIAYRYAYAQRSATDDDRLRVHVSNDCGATWSTRQQLRGALTLNTAGAPVAGDFTPSGPEQWAYTEVTGITSSYYVSGFLLKFELESGGGNNLYIDDININGSPVGIGGPVQDGGGALTVTPNPARNEARVSFTLPGAGQADIELLDVLGRRLMVLHEGHLAAGPHRVDLPVDALQKGVYFVRLRNGARSETVRFVAE